MVKVSLYSCTKCCTCTLTFSTYKPVAAIPVLGSCWMSSVKYLCNELVWHYIFLHLSCLYYFSVFNSVKTIQIQNMQLPFFFPPQLNTARHKISISWIFPANAWVNFAPTMKGLRRDIFSFSPPLSFFFFCSFFFPKLPTITNLTQEHYILFFSIQFCCFYFYN